MNEPLVDEKYERSTVKEVTRMDGGYSILKEDGWNLWIADKKNKMNVMPRPGDEIITYGDGIGRVILGVQINSALVFFEDRAEKERQRNIWIEETNKRYAEEYAKLMEEIKDEEPFETIDVSGMGGGYERACQLMIQAGVKFLQENEFHFDYRTLKGVYGVAFSDAPWSEDLEKVLMDAVGGDCTGAMHQCVIGHLTYIHKESYEAWLSTAPEERKYMYPSELPPPALLGKQESSAEVVE